MAQPRVIEAHVSGADAGLLLLTMEESMRRRLYFLLPDLGSAIATGNDLLLSRIEDRYMHFLGRRGMSLGNLHEASYLQKTDVRQGAELGFVLGGAIGILIGIYIYLTPPDGASFQLGTIVLISSVIGAIFCAWAGSLVAIAAPNSRLKGFAKDIEAGKILLMLDIPLAQVDDVKELVRSRHPEAVDYGIDTRVPAFP
jgi:hypothetical protein